uniref:Uncharacterized protein n=1 Tax=viral metagenome TaxID=1070528 RepID=A0A6C0I197_9ZZZZ
MSSIDKIIEDALKDPTLASTIDIEKLLSIRQENRFEGKSMTTISKQIVDILEIHLNVENVSDMSQKLIGYQHIDQVCDIQLGKFIRWIKIGTKTINRGGILTSIQIEDSGIKLLCRNINMQFFRLKWEECILFQQLSLEEQMVLSI